MLSNLSAGIMSFAIFWNLKFPVKNSAGRFLQIMFLVSAVIFYVQSVHHNL